MAKLHVGAQDMNLTDTELSFLARHGVFHADFSVDDMELATLVKAKAKAASFGIVLEMIHIDSYIMDGAGTRFISAAKEPEREQSIVQMCRMIENAGAGEIWQIHGRVFRYFHRSVHSFARPRPYDVPVSQTTTVACSRHSRPQLQFLSDPAPAD
jgi:hypothetical protein